MDRLTPAQVEHFLDKGYVRMPHCFDRRVADEWRQLAFERLGYDEQDPQKWTEARVHLPGMNRVEVKEFAPAAYSAICDLMGAKSASPCP